MERLAELAVAVGANVQPGQVVSIRAEVGHAELVRALADAAYRHGAADVDADLTDPYLQRSRARLGPADAATEPGWRAARFRELDDRAGAAVRVLGPTAPGLFDDLDPARVARAGVPRSRVWREMEYRVNNTIIPGPNVAWARSLHPGLPAASALSRLWEQIAVACRLDAPDPAAAWRSRFAQLRAHAQALTELRLDAVRLRGPGTDLVVGLPPSARWEAPTNVSRRGVEHAWNLPSEEVYTSPDRSRAEGQVRLTRPAVVGGRLVGEVEVTFRNGRAVGVTGGSGVEALRTFVARDPGAARLGELALVDGDSAVAATGQTFGLILLDENAAGHIALGFGFPELVDLDDRHQVNDSADHLDLTIGSTELEVVGLHRDGREQPLLHSGRWQV